MASETKMFYPGAYKNSSGVAISNAANTVGKGSNNNTSSRITPAFLGTTGYIYWPFDTSAIPDDAEVISVSCKAKANVLSTSGFTTVDMRLYSGSKTKGSSVSFKTTSATAKEIPAGTWTRSELESAQIGLTVLGSPNSYVSFYGADLTVVYTYQSEKFMLKLGGAWHNVARVFKKVSGIWVEVDDLSTAVDTGKKLVNGGEITS